ncbi:MULTISPECIES: hypothetical protein [Burkholderia cepacia complex]|uniref:hypothetical protein n=1 Tax=Burkholderia cepacia complex TaxID=87882 RepID=UPI00264C0C38|nr:hypothetical protein [Burkholderia seminalis]MDN7591811.1 hypothetical protein [Burkholderia seminalis]
MKSSLVLTLTLLAVAGGLALTGVMISQSESHVASILPAGLFYTCACIAFLAALASGLGALANVLVAIFKGD